MNNFKSIEDSVYNYPLIFLEIDDEKILKSVDKFIPFSTGFEIECNSLSNFKSEYFETIPNILHIDCDNSEKRFRIPSGLKGMICLYEISQLLWDTCSITNSGIHYHIDMTDWYGDVDSLSTTEKHEFIDLNKDWILKELDTWEYNGNYNPREVDCFGGSRNWVRFKHTTKTCEIRIGEMTFDYSILIKRIIHCNKIVKRLKYEYYKFKEDRKVLMLERSLKKLEEEEETIKEKETIVEDINYQIKNRVIKHVRREKNN